MADGVKTEVHIRQTALAKRVKPARRCILARSVPTLRFCHSLLSAGDSACTEHSTGRLLKVKERKKKLPHQKFSDSGLYMLKHQKSSRVQHDAHICAFAQTNQKYHKTLQQTEILIKEKERKKNTFAHILLKASPPFFMCDVSQNFDG